MQTLINNIFAISKDIRYVAIYHDGQLASSERPGLANTSASESDKYEELLVNPAILTLAIQRENIDCGGCRFVLIRYGNFFEYVAPIRGGHISVGLELHADPLTLTQKINEHIEQNDNHST
ncbi:MAG: hypothetical protein FJZ86_05765 [Chloroflexi bacterium]|nr:hypothetical protein [Chloroflexota bacterium]